MTADSTKGTTKAAGEQPMLDVVLIVDSHAAPRSVLSPPAGRGAWTRLRQANDILHCRREPQTAFDDFHEWLLSLPWPPAIWTEGSRPHSIRNAAAVLSTPGCTSTW